MLKKAQEREDKIMEKRRHMQVMQLIKGIKLKTTHMIVLEMILILFYFFQAQKEAFAFGSSTPRTLHPTLGSTSDIWGSSRR